MDSTIGSRRTLRRPGNLSEAYPMASSTGMNVAVSPTGVDGYDGNHYIAVDNPYFFVGSNSVQTQGNVRSTKKFFAAESLSSEILSARQIRLQKAAYDPDMERNDISPLLRGFAAGNFERLRPLSNQPPQPPSVPPTNKRDSKICGFTTAMYTGVSKIDGEVVVLRRVDCFLAASSVTRSPIITSWKSLLHPNFVPLLDVFPSPGFSGSDGVPVFFVSKYYPSSLSLAEVFAPTSSTGTAGESAIKTKTGASITKTSKERDLPLEEFLWTITVQLAEAMRHAHSSDHRCLLSADRVLLTNPPLGHYTSDDFQTQGSISHILGNMIMHGGTGFCPIVRIVDGACVDALTPKGRSQSFERSQDIASLGELLVWCILGHARGSVQMLPVGYYSPQFLSVLAYTMSPTHSGGPQSIDDVLVFLSGARTSCVERCLMRSDGLHDSLSREVENGRILRLLCSLEFVLGSTDVEEGDKYLLKLFRDHVFAPGEDGEMNFAYAVDCLNKIDVGVDERVMLASSDASSVLIVSFADIQRCMSRYFQDRIKATPLISPSIQDSGLQQESVRPPVAVVPSPRSHAVPLVTPEPKRRQRQLEQEHQHQQQSSEESVTL